MTTSLVEERERLTELRDQARAAIKQAVTQDQIPGIQTLKCQGCGGQAREYHHHQGYEQEFWLDVIPLCIPCHRKTEPAPKCQGVTMTGGICTRLAMRGSVFCNWHLAQAKGESQ